MDIADSKELNLNATPEGARIESVLVVDNDPSVCTFMAMFLGKHDFTVETAEDGLAALTFLENSAPDVVFIDLVMPNISGEKLCQILRSQRRFDNTYCIVLSAISSEEEFDYQSYGFDVCIAKGPLKKLGEVILDVISKLGGEITRTNPGGIYGLEHLYRREITRELLSTKRHFELILGNMAESIIETTAEGKIVFANPAAVELLGMREEVLLSVEFVSLFEQSSEAVNNLVESAASGSTSRETIERNNRVLMMQILPVDDDGRISLVILIEDVTERKAAEAMVKSSRDELEERVRERTGELASANESLTTEISNRQQLEERLRGSLREKEVLIDEVHHRVKNNLQIVSSLFGLSANRIENPELQSIISDMRHRIHSLSLVHDKLYRSTDLASVKMKDYVSSLVHSLVGSYSASNQSIDVVISAEGISFDLERAVPCALIVNELVTNALKYAFPDQKEGTIKITFMKIADGRNRMEVRDNGIGLPASLNITSVESFGFRIVKVIAGQLGARMQIGKNGGALFRFEFP